uniref:DZF domain-containing protein n=1 Tax=Trichobilharzia regenti TaxID=157069 RepID=A0AA85JIM1_TRIRE|nr:unnamed protein product [Trichobilharzia regenti]
MVGRRRGRQSFRRNNPAHAGQFIRQLPFDIALLQPDLAIPADDQNLLQCLLNQHAQLTPSSDSQHALTNLNNGICEILDNIIMNPSIFESAQLEHIHRVGSFKMGTWLNGSCIADLVCVLRTLPTREAVQNLANFVRSQLTTNKSSTEYINCKVELESYGFSVTSGDYVVQVLITTTPMNLNKVDPNIHINLAAQKTALASIRHLRWTEERASHPTVKVLTRILKDFRRRFRGFSCLNSWLIILLAQYAVMNSPQCQPLPLNHAFRRVLYLLSSGFLLPGSTGLLDPCEPGYIRLHSLMSLAQQDGLCCTAQVLLRILIHGGHQLLFTQNDLTDDSREKLLKAASKLVDSGNFEWPEPVIEP